jgi:phosphoserine phosphatase RsbU/P
MPEPRLQVHDSLGQRVIALNKPVFTIGRRSTSDLPLMDTEVSREHAEIAQVEGHYIVRDRGSRYGTYVNGEPVDADRALAHGDRISLGRTGHAEVRFLVDDDVVLSSDGTSLAVAFRQIATVLQSLRSLGGARVLDDVLALVMDAAIEITAAERGFVMLADRDGTLELKLARAQGRISLPLTGFDRSQKIPQEVFASGEGRIVADLQDDRLAAAHQGTVALGIRHVLCVPLKIIRYVEGPATPIDARSIGVLYLDSRERGTLASRAALTALETLASEAAGAIENARLYREAQEKARLDEELRIASQIQQALLPPSHRQGAFFEAYGRSISCRAIGGDFFDYIDQPDGGFAFALGDVAGKGAPAALLTAVLQGILTGQAAASAGPADTMARVNHGLLVRAVDARFATAFFATLTADGRLACCNAGHNPPFLLTGDGVRRLEAGGLVLGLFPQATYEQELVQLAPGDTVVVFSDGVSEALDAAGAEFGDERILAALQAARSERPQAMLTALLDSVQQFSKGVPQNDDVTALVVRFTA